MSWSAFSPDRLRGACYLQELTATEAGIPEVPDPGRGFFYLITVALSGGEGSAGTDSYGEARILTDSCE